MNLTSFFLERKTFSLVLMAGIVVAGILSFLNLGRLEDPEFTIKTAIVATQYPGASAEEVELEVTDKLETAIQGMDTIKDLRSISRPGMSIIFVNVKEEVNGADIPQTWDELRRKVRDSEARLPPDAQSPMINDDWADVYGIFLNITGDGYSTVELHEIAKDLRRELVLVDGVGSVALYGQQPEAVYIEMPRARMSQMGMTPITLASTLYDKGSVVPAGSVHVGDKNVRIAPTGSVDSVQEIGDTLVKGQTDSLVRLRDQAEIYRGTWDSPPNVMYFDGKPAIGLGISTASGGSVVKTGEAVQARLDALKADLPLGVEVGVVSYQPTTVDAAVSDFIVGLVEAVVIVVALLLIFMGPRSGMIIGGVLLFTILGTFVFMDIMDITLQRISLGALVIALGMLVDNAIVVVEGVLVRVQQGVPRVKAAIESVVETQWPLLGATAIAILAFAAISLSPDSVGEFLASLFQVIAISLLLSWVLAVTITPLLAVMFLKVDPSKQVEGGDVYGGLFFQLYRKVLNTTIRHRWLTIAATGVIFVGSLYSFQWVEQNFFPSSAQPSFFANYWKAEGAHIRDTEADLKEITAWLQKQEEVKHVSTFVGQGALRFQLTYEGEMPNPSYGQLLIEVEDTAAIPAVEQRLIEYVKNGYTDSEMYTKRFALGPGGGAKVEARFSGPDPVVLRQLSEEAQAILHADGQAKHIRDDWRGRVPVIKPKFDESQARAAGVSRADLNRVLEMSSSGVTMGLYRENDTMLPIILRLPEKERTSADNLMGAQVYSRLSQRALPARVMLDGVETTYEDNIIRRFDKARTLTVQADPATGQAAELHGRVKSKIEAIALPPGYSMEWGGEYESSTNANTRMMSNLPLCMALMVLVVIALFNELRTPIVIFALVPLSLVGVVGGLLLFDQPFGFMATLGVLSLMGMMIKNAIVLIEQIKLNNKAGMDAVNAVVEAGVSRVRPVALAAFTTVLGMIPLVTDVFFGPMAVTIMAGLTIATVLTLLLLPVVYATVYRLRPA